MPGILRRLSVRAKLILSFAIIVLASTVVFAITFFGLVERNYLAQIDQGNRRSLEILAASLERERLEPAVVYASEMAINASTFPDIHRLIYTPEDITPVHIQRIQLALRQFSYHDMGLFTDVMVYSGDRNLTIANTNGVVYLDIADKKHPGSLWWLQEPSGGARSDWLYGNINPSIEQEGLLYVYHFASPVSGGTNAFAFQFSSTSLEAFINSQRSRDTGYLLLTEDGRLLYGDPELLAALEAVRPLDTLASGAAAQVELLGERCMINAVGTGTAGLTLLSVTPTSILYSEANALAITLRVIGVLTFAVGLVLSYFLTERLYRPLRAIRVAAPEGGGTDGKALEEDAGLNEYEYIGAVLQKLNARAAELEKTLTDNLPHLLSTHVHALLEGDPRESGSEGVAQLRRLGLAMDMPLFSLLQVQLPEALAEALPPKDMESILLALMGMVDGLSDPRQYRLYSVRNHPRGFTTLVNYHLEGVDGRMQLRSLAAVIHEHGLSAYNVQLLCLVTSRVHSPALLYQLSTELEEIAQYHFYLWRRPTLLAEDIPALADGAEELPPELMRELEQAAAGRKVQEIAASAQRMVDAFESGRYHHEICHQALLETMRRIADAFPEQPALYAQLNEAYLKCASAGSMVEEILRHIRDVEGDMEKDAPTRGQLLARRAAEILRESAHRGVGIEDIAPKLRVSPSYLGRLFREEMGVTPSEYANLQRLEQSLVLLETTDLRIEAIATRSGFGSTAYYIKKFREQYGMTPKNYRVQSALRRERTAEEETDA